MIAPLRLQFIAAEVCCEHGDYKDYAAALSSALQDAGIECPCGYDTPRRFWRWWQRATGPEAQAEWDRLHAPLQGPMQAAFERLR